jgi:hypothetical protein
VTASARAHASHASRPPSEVDSRRLRHRSSSRGTRAPGAPRGGPEAMSSQACRRCCSCPSTSRHRWGLHRPCSSRAGSSRRARSDESSNSLSTLQLPLHLPPPPRAPLALLLSRRELKACPKRRVLELAVDDSRRRKGRTPPEGREQGKGRQRRRSSPRP